MAPMQSIDRLTAGVGVSLWRLVACALIFGWMCLAPGTAQADGTVVAIDAKFAIDGTSISPQCVLALVPLASGDVLTTEVPVLVPNLRGCADGNFNPSVQGPKNSVSTTTQDGRRVAYRLLGYKNGNYLLRMSVAEQGSLVQMADLWVATRSRPLRHVLPNGRVVTTVITVLVLEGLSIPKGAEELSRLQAAFDKTAR